jgi:hypothetical protein
MADNDHLANLRRGVDFWNKWRAGAPRAAPDLSGADLVPGNRDNFEIVSLARANLTGTNLSGARLSGADLSAADLTGADLTGADLSHADLRGASIAYATLSDATVGGMRYDRAMRCRGANVESCKGDQRFKRHVLEADYVEAYQERHPVLGTLWRLTSDYSRSVSRTALVALVLVLIFAISDVAARGTVYWDAGRNGHVDWLTHWFLPFYYSANTFDSLGTGNSYPLGTAGQILSTSEGILGYLWLGYLISVLAQRTMARA